jgi:hypothetical protein
MAVFTVPLLTSSLQSADNIQHVENQNASQNTGYQQREPK